MPTERDTATSDLEDRLQRAESDAKAALICAGLLAFTVWIVHKAVEALEDAPAVPSYWERRLDELEHHFYLHLHPKEIIHEH